MNTGAEFSEDKKYRYKLWRIWDESKPMVMCIGLNPSNANEGKNDPTINNLISVLTKLGYGGFYMMNIFAVVSSNPKYLLTCVDPFGENTKHINQVANPELDVIFCWGDFKQVGDYNEIYLQRFPEAKCFGKNASGSPLHPRGMTYIKGMLENPQIIKYNHQC